MAYIHTLENGEVIIRDDWGAEDIQSVADYSFDMVLTPEEVTRVMEIVVEGFDANVGINWVSFVSAIVLMNKEK